MAPGYLRFWGKAQPRPEATGAAWHPLAYHSLDVAAVVRTLLERDPGRADMLATLLGTDRGACTTLLTALAALHDIGKFAAGFQGLARAVVESAGLDLPALPYQPRHDAAGLLFWDGILAAPLAGRLFRPGTAGHQVRALLAAVSGHHGAPCDGAVEQTAGMIFPPACREAAIQFAEDVLALLLGAGTVAPPPRVAARLASWPIAGVLVEADWIGSSQEWFPYEAPVHSLDAYWRELALPRAARAVAEAGVGPKSPGPFLGFDRLLNRSGFAPSPVQAWAAREAVAASGVLTIVEELTGTGKTEAALMLAHRTLAAGEATGLYFALPTMATSNAMYRRVGDIAANLFAPGEPVSVVLAHGKRDQDEAFVARLGKSDGGGDRYGRGAGETTASASCAAWLGDDRRKALLADVGIGTVDQALLAALPARFQPLRLHGLVGKVLVVDEVHAYDAYTMVGLERLLGFVSRFGGSAILLSATLPTAMRARLIEAWVGNAEAPRTLEMSYPLVTQVTRDGRTSQAGLPTREGAVRDVPVRIEADSEAVISHLVAAARSGACAAWIRNSVDDAREAYQTLVDALGADQVHLFHARFALGDRLAREDLVLSTFGPEAPEDARRGRVLVATQVAEQSLDLDFDVMVSDLAPVDALVQRQGRLWRHGWRARVVPLAFVVHGPDPDMAADGGWLRRALPRTAAVYRDHGVLWRTARELKARGKIALPGDARALIEAVYAEDRDDLPAGLRPISDRAEGETRAEWSIGTNSFLMLDRGYVRQSGQWDQDVDTPTRLGEPQVTIRLARWNDGRLVPWATEAGDDTSRRAWHRSEVAVLHRRVAAESDFPPDLANAAKRVRQGWPDWEARIVIVPLIREAGSGSWLGAAKGPDGQAVVIRYDAAAGLAVTAG